MLSRLLSGKADHLVRYFVLLGLLSFGIYWFRWNDSLAFCFLGPVIYLSFWLREILSGYTTLPDSETFNSLAILLPLTFFYYLLIGAHFKRLWNEMGLARTLTILALLGFLLYIHLTAWYHLSGYYTPVS